MNICRRVLTKIESAVSREAAAGCVTLFANMFDNRAKDTSARHVAACAANNMTAMPAAM